MTEGSAKASRGILRSTEESAKASWGVLRKSWGVRKSKLSTEESAKAIWGVLRSPQKQAEYRGVRKSNLRSPEESAKASWVPRSPQKQAEESCAEMSAKARPWRQSQAHILLEEPSWQQLCYVFVFELFVASKKGIPSKNCILSCFVWLKSLIFNLLCVIT